MPSRCWPPCGRSSPTRCCRTPPNGIATIVSRTTCSTASSGSVSRRARAARVRRSGVPRALSGPGLADAVPARRLHPHTAPYRRDARTHAGCGVFDASCRDGGRRPGWGRSPAQQCREGARLRHDEGLALAPASKPVPGSECRRLVIGGNALGEVQLSEGTSVLRNPGRVTLILGVRRFADPADPHYVGLLSASTTARLTIPPDRAPLSWHLVARTPSATASAIIVCRG
jgi:hypothetical protein